MVCRVSDRPTTMARDKTRAMLMLLLSRIDLKAAHVEIRVHRQQLVELLRPQSMDPPSPARATDRKSDDILTLTVKARLQRVGREMRLLVENADGQTLADPGLLRVIARAHDFQERLTQDPNLTVPTLASQERLSIGYMSRLLRLPTLAPDIITAIINGKNPPQLTAKKLMRLTAHIPVDWAEQRKLLGFQGQ
jgi:site-specific DNA recombinase